MLKLSPRDRKLLNLSKNPYDKVKILVVGRLDALGEHARWSAP
jgi:hypothetical protein